MYISNFEELKLKAVAVGSFKNDSRGGLISEIFDRFDAHNIPIGERNFMASYLLSQYGYGGGL